MYKLINICLKEFINFYYSLKINDIMLLVILHVFISWNGFQFILDTSHLSLIIDNLSILYYLNIILQRFTNYIPILVFTSISGILIFFFLHNYLEIIFYRRFFRINKQLSDDKFNLFVNYSMPAFFYNLWILFILATIYLVFIVIYIFILIFGVYINLNIISVIQYSTIYFLFCIFFFNLVINDFVLPLVIEGNTFTDSIKKLFNYLLIHKLQLIKFYLLKFSLILINLTIFSIVLDILQGVRINHGISFNLPHLANRTGFFNSMIVLSLGILISLVLNAFGIHFLNIYVTKLKFKAFRNYFTD